MTFKPVYTFSFLSLAFLAFSFSIYLNPALTETAISIEKQQAAAGRLVWQKYNCQSCHQLYGLGGYLGPDLTNVYAAPGKGEALIRAVLKTGVAPMPSFDMAEEEITLLVSFLKETDASGTADPRGFVIQSNGMTQRK
jgi:nitric oxide reductase subunit C